MNFKIITRDKGWQTVEGKPINLEGFELFIAKYQGKYTVSDPLTGWRIGVQGKPELTAGSSRRVEAISKARKILKKISPEKFKRKQVLAQRLNKEILAKLNYKRGLGIV